VGGEGLSSPNEETHVSYFYPERALKERKFENFARLQNHVILSGVCTECTACVASCPENALEMVDGRPTLKGKCTACGVCYNVCPRTRTHVNDLIGDFISAYKAKCKIDAVHGQDGGVVTGLLLYALREGLIDGAVVTHKSKEEPWKPVAVVATTEEEILEGAGSVYSHSYTVKALIDAIKKGLTSLAFVGTPCNISAVKKMQGFPAGMLHLLMRANILKIGLFCMDSFSYDGLRTFFEEEEKIPLASISKMSISAGKFSVYYDGDKVASYPLSRLDKYRASSCYFCSDLTSEDADISVGSVGSPEGYSTVLVRSPIALELLYNAADNGYLEVEPLDRQGLTSVLNLARVKKVQLYTVKRRRTYVVRVPGVPLAELELKAGPIPLEKEAVEGIKLTGKSPVKVVEYTLTNNGQELLLILQNTSGQILYDVNVRISHVDELFETNAWATDIEMWHPLEELEFKYPRALNDREYLVRVATKHGPILMKRITIAELKKE